VKLLIAIAILVAVVLVGSVGTIWYVVFSGSASHDPESWAAFGAYFGGTLSPLIAVMALMALLYTIYQQQKQITHLTRQSAKEDLSRAIERIEKDIAETLGRYPINIVHNGQTRQYSGADVLFNISFLDYEEVIPCQEDVDKLLKSKQPIGVDHPTILAYEMFADVGIHLSMLRTYVGEYDKTAKNDVLSTYYRKKYKRPIERLVRRGLMRESREPAKS
jgi:uncharacterized membrane protein